MLATAGDCIKLWDSSNFSPLHTIPPASGGADVARLSWSNDGSCLASAADAANEVALRVVKGTSVLDWPSVKGLNSAAVGIAYANKAACYLAVAESAGRVLVWDVKQRARKKVYMVKERGGSNTLSSVVFSPSDSHIAVGTDSGSVQLLSVTNNTVTGPHLLFQDKSRVTCLTYSLVRRGLLGASSASGGVCYLDVHSGRVSQASQGHKAPCHSLAFSPINDLLLVSGGYDKKIHLYNVNTLKTAQVLSCDAPVTSVAFLPAGLAVCAGTLTGEVLVHDLRSIRVPVSRWQAHASHVTCIALQSQAAAAGRGASRQTPSAGKKVGSRASRSSSSSASKPSPGGQGEDLPVTPSTCSKSAATSSSAVTNTPPSFGSGMKSSSNSVGGLNKDLLDLSEMLSPVRTDASPSVLSPLNPHHSVMTDYLSGHQNKLDRRTAAMASRDAVQDGRAAAESDANEANISDAEAYEDDGILSPLKKDPSDMSPSLKLFQVPRVAVVTASPPSPVKEAPPSPCPSPSSPGQARTGGSALAASTDAPPPHYAGPTDTALPHYAGTTDAPPPHYAGPTPHDGGDASPPPADDGGWMTTGSVAADHQTDVEHEAELDYEDELLSPVRDFSFTPQSRLQRSPSHGVPGTPLPGSSHPGASKVSVAATPARSSSNVSHLSPSNHDPSSMQSSNITPRNTSKSRNKPEQFSNSQLIQNSHSRIGSVSNKENVPLGTSPQLPSRSLGQSSIAISDGKQIGTRPTVTRGSVLPLRSVQSPNTNKSGKDTPLKNVRLESLTCQENTSSATSNSSTVEDLQKKYHSIVARMNQENELQNLRGPAISGLLSSEVSGASSGLDLERLADLVAARLSGGSAATSSSAGVSPATAASSGLSPSSAAAVTSDSLTVSLVRSCVSDVMEEVEAGMNRRFMHLQYLLITHLMEQTREIEQLHKKYSLNEDLLEENLRLQEEIKYLRGSY